MQMECDLPEKSEVFQMSKAIGVSRYEIVGRLLVFWSWCDKHSVDGRVDAVDVNDVDDVVRLPGFAQALIGVKWLEVVDAGIVIPKHERHFGKSAKSRILKSERQARWRKNRRDGDVDATPSTQATTREEKSINTPISPLRGGCRVFVKPTSEEMESYAQEINLPVSECSRFFDYHEARGWRLKTGPMKCWRSAMRTWRDSPYRHQNGKSQDSYKLPTEAAR